MKKNYILALKNLCYKLKEGSPEFFKGSMEELSVPVQNFIKQKVFFFEGNIAEKGLRKFIKVKK